MDDAPYMGCRHAREIMIRNISLNFTSFLMQMLPPNWSSGAPPFNLFKMATNEVQ